MVFVAQARAATALPAAEAAPSKTAEAIPWSQIGAKAGADYKGDGLTVTRTESGARLRCVFQRLEGDVTSEGLWLTSTANVTVKDRFRVVASSVGRVTPCAPSVSPAKPGAHGVTRATSALPAVGDVSIDGQSVRFTRPGLVEEYTVSMDGVRQDFLILEKPGGVSIAADWLDMSLDPLAQDELRVELSVSGAKVETAADGARLVLENSGRKIAYGRVRVTDATGRELPARMEVADKSENQNPKPKMSLAVLVNDADAVYPVRIDPTFSDANWISMGGVNGADEAVYAAVVDGAGNLYIGGNFTVVGDVIANRVAKWNGSNWSALGSGFNYLVGALAVSGSNLYAGGEFTMAGDGAANYIAKWNGSGWSALGSGMNLSVLAITVSGGDVYVGGHFTTAGGSTANHIAKWDGSSWSTLGLGMDSTVLALAVSGSDVYAGGYFEMATNSEGAAVVVNRIAKWNGNNWSALGSGLLSPGSYSYVQALAVSGSNVYAGGFFARAGGNTVANIARWNGSSWSGLGSGLVGGYVTALAVSGSDVYAGGFFSRAGSNAVNNIAKWNGSSWTTLGSGMNGVLALAVSGSNVYAGSNFRTAGGIPVSSIAKWNGSSWSALGSGMNDDVYALAVSGSDVYVGGTFTAAGNGAANFVAKWDGSSWSTLGSGLNNYVLALAVSGTDVYAGGYFTMAGSNSAKGIARWNGNSWSVLGSGLDGYVHALSVSGRDVYVGGTFTTAGGSAANRIAKWNGSSWSTLGSGMNGIVNAIAASGSDVFAGGWFTTAGGIAANYIARWDGNSWLALGSGMSGSGSVSPYVYALAVSGRDLYAGGGFTTAGGIAANYIAKWNGSGWSALGSEMGGDVPYVTALAMLGKNLYAGGRFTTVNGSAVNYIAKWDGSSWSALGSGMNGYVQALAVSGSDLYAGGLFTTVGGKVSAYVAKAVVNRFAPVAVANVSPLFAVSLNDTNLFILSPNNANATVVFDGSQSSDADGDPLQYFWYADDQTNLLATGATSTNLLPVGPHKVTLVVTDGHYSGTAQASFEIITPATAAGLVLRFVDTSEIGVRNKQPLLAILRAAMAAFDRGDFATALKQLSAFQNQVRAQVAPVNPEQAASLTQAAQQVVDALSGGNLKSSDRSRVRFTAVTRESDGHVRMRFSADAGNAHWIEASTNLVDWERIGVAKSLPDGGFEFVETPRGIFERRFYRIATPGHAP